VIRIDETSHRRRAAYVWLTASLALVPAHATAGTLADRIQACAAIGDNNQRLACFDALASESRQPAAPAPAVKKEDTFGMEQSLMAQSRTAPDAVSEIRAPVRRIGTMASGWMVIELENGQTWTQAEALRNPVPLSAGDEVTIRRGVLGSFVLSTADNRTMRVRRKN